MKKSNHLEFIVLFVIIIYNTLLFFQSPEQIIILTKDDNIVENASAISYLFSAIILFYLFFKSRSDTKKYLLGTNMNYFFLFLGVFFIVCLGEEISWGQRIFNFSTPQIILENNRQGELNIHNLNFWEALDKHDKSKHGLIRFYSSVALYSYFWFLYCVMIPILNKYTLKIHNIITRFYLPIIPIFLGSLFLINFITFELIERIDIIDLRSSGEIKETNFALLFLFASISLYMKHKNNLPQAYS